MLSKQLTGRELDAEIAAKLFGWRWIVIGSRRESHRVFEIPWRYPGCRECATEDMDLPIVTGLEIPRFSESWDDMRLVIEAMRKRGWWCRMDTPFVNGCGDEDSTEGRCEAGFFGHGCAPRHAGMAFADSLPVAVCRAALAAIEGSP